eukprot:12466333-Ditylum_brightwellii.AAC.1
MPTKRYYSTIYIEKKELFTCSSCGIRDQASKYHIWNITYLHVLHYDEAAKELLQDEVESEPLCILVSKDDWKHAPLSNLRSIYHQNGQSYHLHPDFVQVDSDDNYMTHLSDSCNKSISSGDIPDLFIANGLELGD